MRARDSGDPILRNRVTLAYSLDGACDPGHCRHSRHSLQSPTTTIRCARAASACPTGCPQSILLCRSLSLHRPTTRVYACPSPSLVLEPRNPRHLSPILPPPHASATARSHTYLVACHPRSSPFVCRHRTSTPLPAATTCRIACHPLPPSFDNQPSSTKVAASRARAHCHTPPRLHARVGDGAPTPVASVCTSIATACAHSLTITPCS